MQAYEYKVVSAPRRGAKVKGARAPGQRFAGAVEAEMNRMAAEGWEYVRSDTLPHEERPRWFSAKATVMRSLLVFRRPLASAELRLGAPVVPPPPPAMAPFPDLAVLRPAERAPPAAQPAMPAAPPPLRAAARVAVSPPAAPSPAAPVPPAGFRRPAPPPAVLPPEPALEPPPLAKPSSRLPLEDILPSPEPGRGERGGE